MKDKENNLFLTFKRNLIEGKEIQDEAFDLLLPDQFQTVSDQHYTSIYIRQLASEFLAKNNDYKILDLGSGIGKFLAVIVKPLVKN